MLSKALGSRTVMSGSISKSKNDPSESLQMMERPLMTPDELKSIPKGEFIVMKTGVHPMRTRLRLFLDWGITFGKPYVLPERAAREVAYADKNTLLRSINARYPRTFASARSTRKAEGGGSMRQTDEQTITAELPEALEEKAEYHYNLGDGGVTP